MAKTNKGQIEKLLSQNNFFSSLRQEDIEVIAGYCELREYSAADTVFDEGSPGDALYIIESGEVLVRKKDDLERTMDIARFVAGDCFGEIDLFSNSSRNASAIASGQAKLLVFPGKGVKFKELLENRADLSARILHRLLSEIGGRIRGANNMIKENTQLVQELKKQIYRDKLTGIFNRAFLLDRMKQLAAQKGEGKFSLLIVKPDNFKALNDTYGHEAGDMAIKLMAEQLRDFIGDDERTARYHGNAMAVLFGNCDRKEAYAEAEKVRKFISSLDVGDIIKQNRFQITASVGITFFPEHGRDPEALAAMASELPLAGRRLGGNLILFPEDIGGNL